MGDRDLLFLGCARDEVFLEGSFYPAKEPHTQKFLKFFHFLRISHVLFEKEITYHKVYLHGESVKTYRYTFDGF
jgi:hypothetical protein